MVSLGVVSRQQDSAVAEKTLIVVNQPVMMIFCVIMMQEGVIVGAHISTYRDEDIPFAANISHIIRGYPTNLSGLAPQMRPAKVSEVPAIVSRPFRGPSR